MLPTTNAGLDDYHLGPHIMVAVHGTDIPYPVIPLHATP